MIVYILFRAFHVLLFEERGSLLEPADVLVLLLVLNVRSDKVGKLGVEAPLFEVLGKKVLQVLKKKGKASLKSVAISETDHASILKIDHLIELLKHRATVESVALPVRLGSVFQHERGVSAEVDGVDQKLAVRDGERKLQCAGALLGHVSSAANDKGRGHFLEKVVKEIIVSILEFDLGLLMLMVSRRRRTSSSSTSSASHSDSDIESVAKRIETVSFPEVLLSLTCFSPALSLICV